MGISKKHYEMIRTGIGYDVHKLEKNLDLIIGGITIPSEFGSLGHSDGDALIHAIVDALLGASALGDIGTYFPSDDKEWENCSSNYFLSKTVKLIERSGFEILNIDSTIVLEKPRLEKFIPSIINNLSEITGIQNSAISVKATTSDRLGFVGEGNGWSVFAIVTLKQK